MLCEGGPHTPAPFQPRLAPRGKPRPGISRYTEFSLGQGQSGPWPRVLARPGSCTLRTSLRSIGVTIAGLLIIGLVALLAWGISNKSPVTALSGITLVQRPAPEFTVPVFDGGEFALSEVLGRPLVINFWASWCAPCREEARGLERAWRTLRDDGVVVVGINIQDSEEDARAYLREFDITYPNGRDEGGKVTIDYGIIGIPATFFVSRAGIVERRWVGAIPESRLLAWIDDLRAGVTASGDAEGANPESYFRFGQDR